MSVVANSPRENILAANSTSVHRLKQSAVVVVSVAVGFSLTLALGPLIPRAVFTFLYAAVVVSAAYAGSRAGFAAALLSAGLVAYTIMPPRHSPWLESPADATSIAAFIVVSSLLGVLVASLRKAQQAAEATTAKLTEQTAELDAQQDALQSLMQELGESNVELEAAVADATSARDSAIADEERLRLLDEASRVLASSLDYETTVAAAARLAVPVFADWSVVDLLDDGAIKQLAIAHADPERADWARRLGEEYPADIDASTGVPAVIRTGEPQLVPVVTDQMLLDASSGARCTFFH